MPVSTQSVALAHAAANDAPADAPTRLETLAQTAIAWEKLERIINGNKENFGPSGHAMFPLVWPGQRVRVPVALKCGFAWVEGVVVDLPEVVPMMTGDGATIALVYPVSYTMRKACKPTTKHFFRWEMVLEER